MPVKAVLFDLEGTLVVRSLSKSETFHQILTQKGVQIPTEAVKKALWKVKEAEELLEEHLGKISCLEYHNLWSFRIFKILGVKDPDGNLARAVNDQWIDCCGLSLRPDVLQILLSLRHKKVKTGIISGIYQEEIIQILNRVNLNERLFDVLVGADTFRVAKPDPEVFIHTLEQLNVKPGEAIYVGDDLERDYKPAEKAGMSPLLITDPGGVQDSINRIRDLTSIGDYLDQ